MNWLAHSTSKFCPQVEAVSHTTLGCLLSPWGLVKELLVLRNVFLLASPAMNVFVDGFVRLLIDKPNMKGISEQQLEDLLAVSAAAVWAAGGLPDMWATYASGRRQWHLAMASCVACTSSLA
jgi:hypothetical protein